MGNKNFEKCLHISPLWVHGTVGSGASPPMCMISMLLPHCYPLYNSKNSRNSNEVKSYLTAYELMNRRGRGQQDRTGSCGGRVNGTPCVLPPNPEQSHGYRANDLLCQTGCFLPLNMNLLRTTDRSNMYHDFLLNIH